MNDDNVIFRLKCPLWVLIVIALGLYWIIK